MESVKILVDGEEVTIVTKLDKDDIETNDFDEMLEDTIDLKKELKELEKTIEFKKGDFYGQ